MIKAELEIHTFWDIEIGKIENQDNEIREIDIREIDIWEIEYSGN